MPFKTYIQYLHDNQETWHTIIDMAKILAYFDSILSSLQKLCQT